MIKMSLTFLDGNYYRVQNNEEYRNMFDDLYKLLNDNQYWYATFDNYDKKVILEQFHTMIGLATELTDILSFRRQWNVFISEHGKDLFVTVNKLLVVYLAQKNRTNYSKILANLHLPGFNTQYVYDTYNDKYVELESRTIDFDRKKQRGDTILPNTRELVRVWKEFVWTDFKVPTLTGNDTGLIKPPVEFYNMLFDPKLLRSVEENNITIVERITEQMQSLIYNIKIENENGVQEIRNNIKKISDESNFITFSSWVITECCAIGDFMNKYIDLKTDIFMYYILPSLGKEYDKSRDEKPFNIQDLKDFIQSLPLWAHIRILKASLELDDGESFEEGLRWFYKKLREHNLEYIIEFLNIKPYSYREDSEDFDGREDSEDFDGNLDSDEYDSEEYNDGDEDFSWMDLSFLTDIKNRVEMPHPPNEIVERNADILEELAVFDYYTLENTPVKEFIKEDPSNNIVIFSEKNDGTLDVHGGFFRNRLQKILDKNEFFYECPFENHNVGVTLDKLNYNDPLVIIKGPNGNLYVSVFDLSKVLKSNRRYWLIKSLDREAIFTTSLDTVNVGRGVNYKGQSVLETAVSADHCQGNSNKRIYTLLPLEFIGLEEESDIENDDLMEMSDSDDDSIERVSGNIDNDWLRQVVNEVRNDDQEGGSRKGKCYCKYCRSKLKRGYK